MENKMMGKKTFPCIQRNQVVSITLHFIPCVAHSPKTDWFNLINFLHEQTLHAEGYTKKKATSADGGKLVKDATNAATCAEMCNDKKNCVGFAFQIVDIKNPNKNEGCKIFSNKMPSDEDLADNWAADLWTKDESGGECLLFVGVHWCAIL